MAKRRVEDILYDESFENKKCDKIKLKLGINREKVQLYFTSMNSLELLVFPLRSKNKRFRVNGFVQ